jgi:serine/threonine-protein kinase RsbW
MSLHDAEQIRIDLPAAYKSLSLVSTGIAEILAQAEGLSIDEKVVYGIQLAAHEVCANIVEHAYADRPDARIVIILTLAAEPRQIIIDLHDRGSAFDLESVPEPNLDEAHEHGYGMFLVRNLVDQVMYAPLASGNHWRLVKQL